MKKKLIDYSDGEFFLDASGLDGFLTAIVSGPETIMPSKWLPALWNGELPEFKTEAELTRFLNLVLQNLNDNISWLINQPTDFQPLFHFCMLDDEEIAIVEDWCFGYMHGVALGNWPKLPKKLQASLDVIGLFGLEENYMDKSKTPTEEQFKRAPEEVTQAAIKLHAYWFSKR